MGTSCDPVPKPAGIVRKSACSQRRRLRCREMADSASSCGFQQYMGRAHDPFAMQKVEGSSAVARAREVRTGSDRCCANTCVTGRSRSPRRRKPPRGQRPAVASLRRQPRLCCRSGRRCRGRDKRADSEVAVGAAEESGTFHVDRDGATVVLSDPLVGRRFRQPRPVRRPRSAGSAPWAVMASG
jgi:hypothetical protein